MAMLRLVAIFGRTRSQACSFSSKVRPKMRRLPPGYHPMTAYNLYVKEMHQAKKPEETFGDVLVKAGWVWRQLDESVKADFAERAKMITEERQLAYESLSDAEKDELKQQLREKTEKEKADKESKIERPIIDGIGRYVFVKEYGMKKPEAESLEEMELLFDEAMKAWHELSSESKEMYIAKAIEERRPKKKNFTVIDASNSLDNKKTMPKETEAYFFKETGILSKDKQVKKEPTAPQE